jgi:hypothetical protein
LDRDRGNLTWGFIEMPCKIGQHVVGCRFRPIEQSCCLRGKFPTAMVFVTTPKIKALEIIIFGNSSLGLDLVPLAFVVLSTACTRSTRLGSGIDRKK